MKISYPISIGSGMKPPLQNYEIRNIKSIQISYKNAINLQDKVRFLHMEILNIDRNNLKDKIDDKMN